LNRFAAFTNTSDAAAAKSTSGTTNTDNSGITLLGAGVTEADGVLVAEGVADGVGVGLGGAAVQTSELVFVKTSFMVVV